MADEPEIDPRGGIQTRPRRQARRRVAGFRAAPRHGPPASRASGRRARAATGSRPTTAAAFSHQTASTTHDSAPPTADNSGQSPGGTLDEQARIENREQKASPQSRAAALRARREEQQQREAGDQDRPAAPGRIEPPAEAARREWHAEVEGAERRVERRPRRPAARPPDASPTTTPRPRRRRTRRRNTAARLDVASARHARSANSAKQRAEQHERRRDRRLDACDDREHEQQERCGVHGSRDRRTGDRHVRRRAVPAHRNTTKSVVNADGRHPGARRIRHREPQHEHEQRRRAADRVQHLLAGAPRRWRATRRRSRTGTRTAARPARQRRNSGQVDRKDQRHRRCRQPGPLERGVHFLGPMNRPEPPERAEGRAG